MASKCDEVKVFIENKLGERSWNWNMSRNTKWWAKEKKELKAKSADKALKKIENKLAEKLEPSTEFLLWNITKAIELTRVKLEQMEEKWNINVRDLSTIRWMNRIQNWQPTTYVKEESDVNQNIRIEWIHIVMWWNNISQWEKDVDKKV
jgi:ribosomal protein L28